MTEATAEPLHFADIEKSVTPDDVAARCRSYTFQGKPLHAFSKTRQNAARCMNHLLFNGKAKQDDGGIYPEFFRDALIVVWLCSVDDARARRALLNPTPALDEMLDWWESEGGEFGSTAEAEAASLYGSILDDLFTSRAEVDGTGSNSAGDNLGE